MNSKSTMSLRFLLAGLLLFFIGALPLTAQINPAEIRNPHLKAVEQTYLPQLIATQQAIERLKFPFALSLDRYAGLDPSQQLGADQRGLEFVNFHSRVVMKVTANYNAAYNADLMTMNQRASHVFTDVITPVLDLLPNHFSANDSFDDVGFEIAYHVRRKARDYDYEGKEILVVVMEKSDALNFHLAPGTADRQALLNRSDIYLDGREFALALGQDAPLDLEALGRHPQDESVSSALLHGSSATFAANKAGAQKSNSAPPSRRLDLQLPASVQNPTYPQPPAVETPAPAPAPAPAVTQGDADKLEQQYQDQLAALGKVGVEKFHFVDYAPPSFALYRNQIFLQLTLRNPSHFNAENTSIYKRAARTFDLFLAPQIKPILDRISSSMQFGGIDVTVLNELSGAPANSSEAIEYACPLPSLRHFANADITNQDLINQCIVMVNGVRIALNLQQVE